MCIIIERTFYKKVCLSIFPVLNKILFQDIKNRPMSQPKASYHA